MAAGTAKRSTGPQDGEHATAGLDRQSLASHHRDRLEPRGVHKLGLAVGRRGAVPRSVG